MNSELMSIIIYFEHQLNEIIFEGGFADEKTDKERAAHEMKEYLSKIKELVNKDVEIEIKQKLL